MKNIMKKITVLLLSIIMLFSCTSCFFSVPVEDNKVETVGKIPKFYERHIVNNEVLHFGIQVGNVVLYDDSVISFFGKIKVTAYDFKAEKVKTLKYDYSASKYCISGIYAAQQEGTFYMLLIPQTYDKDVGSVVVKSDLEGNIIWETQVGEKRIYDLSCLTETTNGDIYVTGFVTEDLEENIVDYAYVTVLDKNGKQKNENIFTDENDGSYFGNSAYVEEIGLLATYYSYSYTNDAPRLDKGYVMCLDEQGKGVWKFEIPVESESSFETMEVCGEQIYTFAWDWDESAVLEITALDLKGTILWKQQFEDKYDVNWLTDTAYEKPVICSTDTCVALNPQDGSTSEFLYEDEVGIIYDIYYFDDYYVVLSDHVCGTVSSWPDEEIELFEQVYSGYDYDGNLLWRKGFTYN